MLAEEEDYFITEYRKELKAIEMSKVTTDKIKQIFYFFKSNQILININRLVNILISKAKQAILDAEEKAQKIINRYSINFLKPKPKTLQFIRKFIELKI